MAAQYKQHCNENGKSNYYKHINACSSAKWFQVANNWISVPRRKRAGGRFAISLHCINRWTVVRYWQ